MICPQLECVSNQHVDFATILILREEQKFNYKRVYRNEKI